MKLASFIILISYLYVQLFGIAFGKAISKRAIYNPNLFINVDFDYTEFYEDIENPKVEKELIVESTSVITISLKYNTSNGKLWVFENEDEIEKDNDHILLMEHEISGGCHTEPCPSGVNYMNIYRFNIKDPENVPKLRFSYGKVRGDDYELIINFKSKYIKVQKPVPESIKNLKTTFLGYGSNVSVDIDVVSNSTLNVRAYGDKAITGLSWYLENEDDLVQNYSDLVEFHGSSYDKDSDINTFTFTVKVDDLALPILKFSYDINSSRSNGSTITYKLKGYSVDKKKCPIVKYPCCKRLGQLSVYDDSLGAWGIQDGNWCFIDPNNAINCNAKRLGYPCCSWGIPSVYYDDVGSWGIEDGDWCGQPIVNYAN